MSHAAKPRVSVLIPAYNAEATLAETLRSALASTYPDFELIVVDDGSSDRTAAIAAQFARKGRRVRLFRQPHRGVSAALNHGLAKVRGEFIARLDADDLWHPQKLEKQVALFKDPAVALVYTFVCYVDGDGRPVRNAPAQQLAGHALCQCLYQGIIGGGSSVVFRRSVLDVVGGYDEALGIWEDLLLHLRVAAVGEIAFVPEYLTEYRLRSNSSSNDLDFALANWRLASRRIDAAFPAIPAHVRRWSRARWLLELAEGFGHRGRYAISARLVAECLAADFVRTSRFLGDAVHRGRSGKRQPAAFAGRVAELDRLRMRLLESFDRELASASTR